jgi:hypothetical protein
MALTNRLVRWGGARLSRRITRELPVLGAVIAVATIGATVKRKGFFGGLLDTGLNAIPFVGAAKNAAEIVRGRDFIRDRPMASSQLPAASRQS